MLFSICLAVAILAAIGLAAFACAAFAAPYAVEDESGFHVISRQEGEQMVPARMAARVSDAAFFSRQSA